MVRLEFDMQPRDRYGRLLAYVWLPDGRMLNEVLLEEGYAMLLTVPPTVKYVERLRKALRRAVEEEKGLWSRGGQENRCGLKRHCSEMASCREAYFRVCGLRHLDGDGYGVPCERLCR